MTCEAKHPIWGDRCTLPAGHADNHMAENGDVTRFWSDPREMPLKIAGEIPK